MSVRSCSIHGTMTSRKVQMALLELGLAFLVPPRLARGWVPSMTSINTG